MSECGLEGEDDPKYDGLRLRGERLRKAVDAVGSRRVANMAGVPYTTLRGYMAGGDMKLSVLAAVARACGVSIDWIAYGREEEAPDGPGSGDDSSASVSDASLLDVHRLAVRLGLQANDLVAFTALGDAMEPTIRDGDTLVAHRSERAVIVPAVYAIRVDGAVIARRLEQRVDASLLVTTDNARYEAQYLRRGEAWPFQVVGPVIWQAGPMRS